MLFYLGLAVVVIVLSALVIRQDVRAREERLEAKIKTVKTESEKQWDRWCKEVEKIITATCPPEEREWRIQQFYRDNPWPGEKRSTLHDILSR